MQQCILSLVLVFVHALVADDDDDDDGGGDDVDDDFADDERPGVAEGTKTA